MHQLGCPPLATLAVPIIGLLVALGVGLAVGGVSGIPFIAVAVVSYLSVRPPPAATNP
jgi:hypothetical protein